MDKRVNLSKVAKDLGLSVSTVSRALSGSGRVSEETRQRIREYLEDKKLVPNTRKKKYTDVKTNIIAITIPGEEDFFYMPYFQTILSSVYDFFTIRGYSIIFIKTGPDNVEELEQAILNHAMDGVIISRQIDRDDEIELLSGYEVPFVLIGNVDMIDVLQIEFDVSHACFDLTNTLLKMGHHKIAVMGAKKNHPVNQKRLNGIKKAFIKNYMVLDPHYIFWETESDSVAEMAAEQIFEGKIDCIICMDDNICLKMLCILQKMEKKVPDDIRIASLHNSTMLDKWNPPVTCIKYDVHMLGQEAGKLLYTYLTEQKELQSVKLGYQIEMKGSTKK